MCWSAGFRLRHLSLGNETTEKLGACLLEAVTDRRFPWMLQNEVQWQPAAVLVDKYLTVEDEADLKIMEDGQNPPHLMWIMSSIATTHSLLQTKPPLSHRSRALIRCTQSYCCAEVERIWLLMPDDFGTELTRDL